MSESEHAAQPCDLPCHKESNIAPDAEYEATGATSAFAPDQLGRNRTSLLDGY